MAEVVEVERLSSELRQQWAGRVPAAVRGFDPRVLKNISPTNFISAVVGSRVCGVTRRGKYFAIHFKAFNWLQHMMMTGWWLGDGGLMGRYPIVDSPDLKFNPDHSVLELTFSPKPPLCTSFQLVDPRVWSRHCCYLHHEPIPEWRRQGVDVLDFVQQRAFMAESTFASWFNRRCKVKDILVDQGFFCGIGNYLASEIGFAARLNIHRPACSLSMEERNCLFSSVSITVGRAFQVPDYSWWNTFWREGKPCKRPGCDGVISRLRDGTRSTFYCPKCQH